jgi:hypothetical protein
MVGDTERRIDADLAARVHGEAGVAGEWIRDEAGGPEAEVEGDRVVAVQDRSVAFEGADAGPFSERDVQAREDVTDVPGAGRGEGRAD